MLITLARKPLPKGVTVVQTCLTYGVGALNIDATRIPSDGSHFFKGNSIRRKTLDGDGRKGKSLGMYAPGTTFTPTNHEGGRWPANVLLCGDEVLAGFPMTTTNKGTLKTNAELGRHIALAPVRVQGTVLSEGDTGSAARFYKQIKVTE